MESGGHFVELLELTRQLVSIDSTNPDERAVSAFLLEQLSRLAAQYPGSIEQIEVDPGRNNLFVHWGDPVVTLSSHMDTVPPFIPLREDEQFIWGRGSCDAKGIIASMIIAAQSLLREGVRSFGLLFVVGEERDSAGAKAAAKVAGKLAKPSRYLINGEPTENKLALGSKGALRFEVRTSGKTAHSAYPELGHSAIEDLLECLHEIRRVPLEKDPLLGSSTLNIGTISGGRAPNVVADFACAELLFRVAGDPDVIRKGMMKAVAGRGQVMEVLYSEPLRFEPLEGFPSTVVSFTTDVPFLRGAWGQPFLIGPGSIHVAHTQEERIAKEELHAAVRLYSRMVKMLLARN
jgi:acetylornithine deacetylase